MNTPRPMWVCRACVLQVPRQALRLAPICQPFSTSVQLSRAKPKGSKEPPLPPQSLKRESGKYKLLQRLALTRFDLLLSQVKAKGEGYKSPTEVIANTELGEVARHFRTFIIASCELANKHDFTDRKRNPLFWAFRHAFVKAGSNGLKTEIRSSFDRFIFKLRHGDNVSAGSLAVADLRRPDQWYPATRALQRTVHLHVGPTNSGKTYNALIALEQARTGLYAGPLRLLAHEVYTRFNARGIPCGLVTGEEQRIPPNSVDFKVACTVEMSPVNQLVDVAVIDEIQMIADSDRGWAWTNAFLGLQAKELHLCGEERAVELIKSLCAISGDKLIINRYERLNPLKTMPQSLNGNFKKLEKGDAIISFSRLGLWALKNQIERETGRSCAIVYGGLPPETRAQQAALFNDPNNNYDFVAASDAIGMGLNLEIKRVIFETTMKHDGLSFRRLTISELKQIGGRAGRYRTAAQDAKSESGRAEENIGLVTTLDNADLKPVSSAFLVSPPDIKAAGILPPDHVIARFAEFYPRNTPLGFILTQLRDTIQTGDHYFLCDMDKLADVADAINDFPMALQARLELLKAPTKLNDPDGMRTVRAFAKVLSEGTGGHLLEMKDVNLEILDRTPDKIDAKYLHMVESLHRAICVYTWMSYRYPALFHSTKLAFHVKELLEDKINDSLSKMSYNELKRTRRVAGHRLEVERKEEKINRMFGDNLAVDEDHESIGGWLEPGHGEPLDDEDTSLSQLEEFDNDLVDDATLSKKEEARQ